ncbi:hypothetical protein T4D_13168 [Trichinella pseudospiralis]|uniref:Uncharacterized protein n=1 Tax=Trichinella pseudospiralis TaxID=6337 RepID=A0A0V1F5Y3_TRIPS|nr:hypothetical protein T4D_13168 [Trichinella pseudospiralis]
MVGKPLKTGVVVSPAGPLFYQVQTEGGQQWRIRIRMPVHSEQTIDYQKNTTREEKGIVERTLEENAAHVEKKVKQRYNLQMVQVWNIVDRLRENEDNHNG